MKRFFQRLSSFLLRAGAVFLLISVLWVALYRFVDPPGTPLMVIRWMEGYPPKREQVSLSDISPNLQRAVIGAEDSRFCEHGGLDWQAIDRAWDNNQSGGRLKGASTLSMQTAKNLFLWPSRTWLRKGLEAYFTLLIEGLWSKRRILELYLNNVEWGPGLYGAEAAARHHFNRGASEVTPRQAALLAAILPSPLKWSASRPGPHVASRASAYQQRMKIVERDRLDGCLRE